MTICKGSFNTALTCSNFIEAFIMRYQVFKEDWTSCHGDKLDVVKILSNKMDKFPFPVGYVKTETESLSQLRLKDIIAGSRCD